VEEHGDADLVVHTPVVVLITKAVGEVVEARRPILQGLVYSLSHVFSLNSVDVMPQPENPANLGI
jgi:hypothetical protein